LLKLVAVVVVPAVVHVVPFVERSTRYPVARLLACHATLICVDDTAIAETPVGAGGGVGSGSVVADTVADGGELPYAFVAMTRY
jgi:hypothetical protein